MATRRRRSPLDAMDRVGDTQGETGAVDIKESRIDDAGQAGTVASSAADDEAIRQRERAARVRESQQEFDE